MTNPKYDSTYVFTNDFPALLEECPEPSNSEDPLFKTEAAKGTCRVMCFSSKSNVTIPMMAVDEIVKVNMIQESELLGPQIGFLRSQGFLKYTKKNAQNILSERIQEVTVTGEYSTKSDIKQRKIDILINYTRETRSI